MSLSAARVCRRHDVANTERQTPPGQGKTMIGQVQNPELARRWRQPVGEYPQLPNNSSCVIWKCPDINFGWDYRPRNFPTMNVCHLIRSGEVNAVCPRQSGLLSAPRLETVAVCLSSSSTVRMMVASVGTGSKIDVLDDLRPTACGCRQNLATYPTTRLAEITDHTDLIATASQVLTAAVSRLENDVRHLKRPTSPDNAPDVATWIT